MQELHIPTAQLGRLKQMLSMAQRFAPEMIEDATVKVLWEEELDDALTDQGIGAVFYIDDATYQKARGYGAPASSGAVDKAPAGAQDYFDL